jgi:type I restriction enzyme R subunit
VVAVDQIRTIVRTFRDKLPTEIFPGRTEVPKTLIFAKDDSHADDIVQIVREEFGRGNEFCQKITYRTTGAKPEELLAAFRNSYNPRVVVTVDMIATGTDIKPLEIVVFMRSVKSRNFFEQMKGRGVRVIDDSDLKGVTPDAAAKTHFVIVDAVGVTEQPLVDSQPLEKKRSVAFEALLRDVALGVADEATISSLAGRLARLDRQLGEPDRKAIAEAAGGPTLRDLVGGLVAALDPDAHAAAARAEAELPPDAEPTAEQTAAAKERLLAEAAKPLAANPALRQKLVEVKSSFEQTIDTVSADEVLAVGFSAEAAERARGIVGGFEAYIEEHKDEIAALQTLYARPYGQRLRYKDVKALAEAIQAPPRSWTPEALWRAYETLDKTKVRGSGGRLLTDVVALVRFALHQEEELVPYSSQVAARFEMWLDQQAAGGRRFTLEQRRWLEEIRDQVAASLGIEAEDFEYPPFSQRGGLGRVYEVFGPEFPQLLDELNEALAA